MSHKEILCSKKHHFKDLAEKRQMWRFTAKIQCVQDKSAPFIFVEYLTQF